MGVPPAAEALVAAEIFVAHVQPADERRLAVAHHDLAVVAEIELQARPPVTVDSKGLALDSRRLHRLEIAPRQLVRADLVEQEIHLHPGLRPLDERFLEAGAERVVFHDEKVHAQIALRLADHFENPLEGDIPVDQQFQLVPPGEWQSAQELRGSFKPVVFRDVHLAMAQALVHRRRQLAQAAVLFPPPADVAGKPRPPQQPIHRDRQKRNGEQ